MTVKEGQRLREAVTAAQTFWPLVRPAVSADARAVRVVKNLNGHNIERYRIHGGKSVPCVAMPDYPQKMDEGEYFAIETFGSTGRGYVEDKGACSHYSRNPGKVPPMRVPSARSLLKTIE